MKTHARAPESRSRGGPSCSFDAFLDKYGLGDLVLIVRGADTARLDLVPECAGLLAVSLGLSQLFDDDAEQLRHAFVVYDALSFGSPAPEARRHSWNPQRIARAES